MAEHNELGKRGETIAQEFLVNDGYSILATNFRYRKAEIDIIAQKNNILAIVEVKTRTNIAYGTPERFVNKKKTQLLIEATNAFVAQHQLDLEISLDIISVVIGKNIEIQHIKNAYYFF